MIINVKTSKGAMVLGALAVVGFVLGVLVGHYATAGGAEVAAVPEADAQVPPVLGVGVELPERLQDSEEPTIVESTYDTYGGDKWTSEKDLIQTIIDRFDPQLIKESHRFLTEQPHVAASARDDVLANYIRDKFNDSGFDVAELVPYNVLLSKPDTSNPNLITLTNEGGQFFVSSFKEIPIHPDDEDPNFIHGFNAFTPADTVTTLPGVGVVYVNYGRVEDFDELATLGVNITGSIAIVRYGKIYRGNKIRNAELAGAVGVILFSDPEDVAADGTEPNQVYDQTWWLPGSGMQRGSTYLGEGDPLTPGWPSTEHALRLDISEADLHKIPAQPIGYDDARQILELLDGDSAPEAWQGGLSNLTYKLGPNFTPENANVSLTLSTHNIMNVTRSYNVIGIIKGSIEPDRYVMLGNHRDAWGYGAADPSSGTAQMVETARVFGTLLKEGWRPRRTIMFHSWGAEEYGLIGSAEWVEEHIDKLQQRTVAYVNTDTCASGPILNAAGSPMMWDSTVEITKLIPGVVDPAKTLYEEWSEYHALKNPDSPERPIMAALGSGSDHAHFYFYGGIPAVDFWFRRDEIKYNITIYPVYHTGYDTFYWVSTFIDPQYKIMEGCGRLAALTLKYLADSTIIPYNISRYPEEMLKGLLESPNRESLMNIYDKYGELENAVNRFQQATDNFLSGIDVNALDPLQQRAINDQLMKLEQSFIIPAGLPGRATVRHAVFAPSQFDINASNGFPGLVDLLYGYAELNATDKEKRNFEIRRHISDITILTDRATSLLEEVHII